MRPEDGLAPIRKTQVIDESGMAGKLRKAKVTQHSGMRQDPRSRRYRMRVIEDKRHYNQKLKKVVLKGWPGAAGAVVPGEPFSAHQPNNQP